MPQAAGRQNHPFWDSVVKKFFTFPGSPILDASHAVVLTLSEQNDFYPVVDEIYIPITHQLAWIGMYVVFWVILCFGTCGRTLAEAKLVLPAYALGFVVGLAINLLSLFFFVTPTSIFLTQYPRDPYMLSTPSVEAPEAGTYIKDPNDYVHWAQGVGDYHVIIGKSRRPDPDRIGYIYSVPTFLEKLTKGEMRTENLMDYLEGGQRTLESNVDDSRFNPGNQSGLHFFSQASKDITWVAYCMAVIVITWAMYVTNSPWGNMRQLTLNIITVALCLAAGGAVVSERTVVQYNYALYMKTSLIILAAAVGITSIVTA